MTKNAHILVVDDEESMREFLSIMLKREGYGVNVASDGAQALDLLKENSYDLIISDIQMPRLGGFELLAQVMARTPETAMIMITAFSSTEQAVEAMKQGAYDYITKPFKNEEIRLIVKNALERKTLRQENQELKKELGRRYSFGNLIGKSRSMQQVYDLIAKVAASRANILVTGESGTGKELVARAIHYNSDRHEAPFVPINCGAIPENLLESELFGHEKGSFTGAIQQKPGLFEVANGGTLFLDEIGELPAMMQVKLLRVLQEREVRRVGGTRDIPVDVRVVAATNKDLEAEVASGTFREDLFYRLNVIRLALPPLRERRDDIPLLIEHFYQKLTGKKGLHVGEKAMRRLLDYGWPGNIRELENIVERCLVLGQGEDLTEDCLPTNLVADSITAEGQFSQIPDTGLDIDAYLGAIEKDILLKALDKTSGVRKKAAELLGISFRSIRYRLAKFGIEADGDEE
ncbi:MAG: sigma-54 dependent transcriptional regulator [Desulfuromonadales bacterium]|nr:sigma-54 dependent transcriptional regulator [Desulfuromonadales bacterium]MDW7756826.1 sigma-54 dependent transcriptional regulator [Desulfuromonadales bacterium]